MQLNFTSQIGAALSGEAEDYFKSQTAGKQSTSKGFIEKLLKSILHRPELLGRMLGYKDLTPLHGKWILDCWNNQTERETSFQAFRGSYKTTSRVVVGTIWNHLIRPDQTVLICRKTDQGAADTVAEIVAHYEGDVMRYIYKHAFGKSHPLSSSSYNKFQLSTRKKITKERSVESVGVGGSVTGKHFDVILPDDIVTDRDRYYERERERTINFARELRHVVNPGGIIRWNSTLWHRDDAVHTVAPKPRKHEYFPIGTVDIKGVTPEFIETLKMENPPGLYAANYALQLIEDEHPEFGKAIQGELSEEEWRKVKIVAAIDPAYDGTDSTALVIGGRFEGKFFIKYGKIWRRNIADLYHDIVGILEEHGTSLLVVEKNSDKGLSAREFQRLCKFSVKPKDNNANKYQRITTTLKKHWQHIRFGIYVTPEFMAQVCEYGENAKHEDAADALEMLINEFEPGSRVIVGKVRNL